MYARYVRNLLSDTLFAILCRSDTEFGAMYTRSARILLSNASFLTMLRSATGLGFNVHAFCLNSALKHTLRSNASF